MHLNNAENELPEEAVVRLDARPAPDSRIRISTELSDLTVAKTEDDQNRIVHHVLGHVSHKKASATSAVVDGMPKYSKFDTWCTSCQKGKMHMLPQAHDLWNERAANANDVWHIDLIGKFRSPSMGGNSYVVTIIDNHSRYCMAVPTPDKSSQTVLNALKKCMADLRTQPTRAIPTGAASSKANSQPIA